MSGSGSGSDNLDSRRLSFKKAKNLFNNVRKSYGDLPQPKETREIPAAQVANAWDLPFQMLNLDRELLKAIPYIVLKGATPTAPDVFNGSASSGQPLANQTRDFVMGVCKLSELDPAVLASVTQKLASLPQNVADLENSLRTFFNLGLLEETSKAIRILKLVILPVATAARKRLAEALNEKYPFTEDIKTLCINVKFNENGHISVIHSRTERASDPKPEMAFHFIWDCTYIYDTFSNKLKNEINITEFEFDPKMKSVTKRELRELLDPFISQANAYRLLWSRNLGRLPVHKDIARLSNNIEILTDDGEVLYKEPEGSEVPGHQSAKEILTILATRLDDKPVLEAINTKYSDYVKPNGDLSEQLLQFFACGAFEERSPTVKVIKCINQEIVYPAVMVLRNLMYEKFPYKDIKGGWRVAIVFGEKKVWVSHLKKEQSHETNPEGSFGFQWRLRLTFDENMITFEPALHIVDFTFETTLPETKRIIMGAVFHLVDSNAMYRRIMVKPWNDLPVHRDVLRFLKPRGFEVVDQDNKTLYCHEGETNDVFSLIDALTTLASHVETDRAIATYIKEQLPKFVNEEEDLETQFLTFLNQANVPSTSRTMKILKCLHSDLIFPAYLTLRTSFYEDFPFRDLKGSWHVRIQIIPGSSVIVTHIKRERSHAEPGADYFEFSWLVSIIFDAKVEQFQTEVKIIDYFWSDTIKEESKNALRDAWLPFVSVPRKLPSMILESRQMYTASEIIKEVCAALDHQPNTLHAEHPDLPHSMSLSSLLERLNQTLSTVSTLPKIAVLKSE